MSGCQWFFSATGITIAVLVAVLVLKHRLAMIDLKNLSSGVWGRSHKVLAAAIEDLYLVGASSDGGRREYGQRTATYQLPHLQEKRMRLSMTCKARSFAYAVLYTMGLAVTMIGTSPSQAQTLDIDALTPVVGAFNLLADRSAERRFRYREMDDGYLRTTRNRVCETLQPRQQNARRIADAAHEFVRSQTADQWRDLVNTARNGDEFTRFLSQEEELLQNHRLQNARVSRNAREIVLHLAIAQRGVIVRLGPQRLAARLERTLSSSNWMEGVTLLCSTDHSPADNESRANWWSWFYAAGKFLGGIAVTGVNTALAPHTGGVTAALSTAVGVTVMRSGFSDLDTLIR